ncbi:MAG: hypothetical protein JRE28_03210 [Deltaproteobacteria bacterium]|nr:hypothetical protein [Deltaproteobacteria bacterium]
MDEIEINFTPPERDLILNHTFADPELTDKIKIAKMKGKHIITRYSIYHLEDLIGFIAAEANHTEDKQLGMKLDRLFEKLSRILERFV